MPRKTLDSDEIAKLLSRTHKIGAGGPKWPADEDVVRLAKAVETESEEVAFHNGKLFTIKYEQKWDAVFIKPTNGEPAPCGYFNLKRLREVL